MVHNKWMISNYRITSVMSAVLLKVCSQSSSQTAMATCKHQQQPPVTLLSLLRFGKGDGLNLIIMVHIASPLMQSANDYIAVYCGSLQVCCLFVLMRFRLHNSIKLTCNIQKQNVLVIQLFHTKFFVLTWRCFDLRTDCLFRRIQK